MNEMELLHPQLDVLLNFSAQLQAADKNHLHRIATKRGFVKNDFVFKAGQKDLNVYVLNRGRVKLYNSSPEGRDVLLWFLVGGEIFGLAECLQEQARQVYARAVEPCEVLCIPHALFKSWLISCPEVSVHLMKIMALRVRELGHRFLSLANGNIQMETAQLLLRLGSTYGKQAGSHIQIGIPLTEQDLGDMIGFSRQGVSSCLAKMKRLGITDMVKHYLTIKNQEALRKIATGTDGTVAVEARTGRQLWQNSQGVRRSS